MSRTRSAEATRGLVSSLLVSLAVATTGRVAHAGACPGSADTAKWAAPGTSSIGVTEFAFEDASRPTPPNGVYPGATSRRLPTRVWYPAVAPGGPDAPLETRGAPFPVVLYGHGGSDAWGTVDHLVTHLVSHGYVVGAPLFPLSHLLAPGGPTLADTASQPGDLSFVLDRLLALPPGEPLAGMLDRKRVVAAGYSLGATTALLAGYHPLWGDRRVRAVLAVAPAACFFTSGLYDHRRLPLMVVHGDADMSVRLAENGARAVEFARGRRYLVALARGTHVGFIGLAAALDQGQSFDQALLCSRYPFVPYPFLTEFFFPDPAVWGAEISNTRTLCPGFCSDPPVAPPMSAARQHEVTRAVSLAFLDSVLQRRRRRRAGRCHLQRGLRDAGDVTIER